MFVIFCCGSGSDAFAAFRCRRDYIVEEDMMKAARKIAEVKKLEIKLDYD